MKTNSLPSSLLVGMMFFLSLSFFTACHKEDFDGAKASNLTPDSDNGGLTLPTGFGGISVSPETGRARHIAINSNGDIFVKLAELKNGTGILMLKDSDNDGRTNSQVGFGDYAGTGIAIRDGYLYASSDDAIYRYKFNSNNEIENAGSPETIVSGLTRGD
ncbi:MAG: sorbosone dehydrogenase, partial [Pedobacter agri]